MLERLQTLLPWMQQRAGDLDARAAFPSEEIAALQGAGVLGMPLPMQRDGNAHSSDGLAAVLCQVGCGNLAVGRILEAHINARHLIERYGTPRQRARFAADAASGQLFALWVTDPPEDGLHMAGAPGGIRLRGRKMFCSGAGHASRALVTALDPSGRSRMLIVNLGAGERVTALPAPLQGMRAAVTGCVDFTGCLVDQDACLGEAGDYLREPDFSAGAWRGSAVAAGGLQSLLEAAVAQLGAAGRLDHPHQLHRLGSTMIAAETCRLWVRQAGRIAEDAGADPQRTVAYVGLARIAVETACLDAMRLVQRSLGLSAFRSGNPVERISRDLATYLRQPAPDEVLSEAAAYFAATGGA